MFSTISQALRTGEPLHEASHQSLIDRFHYHGTVATQSLADETTQSPLEAITDYNYMFYASAIVAVIQLLEVCDLINCGFICLEPWILIMVVLRFVCRVFKSSGQLL